MKIFTLDEAREALKKAVAEKGADYRYIYPLNADGAKLDECVYADPEHRVPSCIVGHALFILGVPIEAILSLDCSGESIVGVSGSEFKVRLKAAGYDLSPEAREYLRVAQNEQDESRTWGRARESAEGCV